MMFRFLCVALFACSLTFAGCDEAKDGMDDTTATVGAEVTDASDVVVEDTSDAAVIVESADVEAVPAE